MLSWKISAGVIKHSRLPPGFLYDYGFLPLVFFAAYSSLTLGLTWKNYRCKKIKLLQARFKHCWQTSSTHFCSHSTTVLKMAAFKPKVKMFLIHKTHILSHGTAVPWRDPILGAYSHSAEFYLYTLRYCRRKHSLSQNIGLNSVEW